MKVKTAILIFIALFILLGIAVLWFFSFTGPVIYQIPDKVQPVDYPNPYKDVVIPDCIGNDCGKG